MSNRIPEYGMLSRNRQQRHSWRCFQSEPRATRGSSDMRTTNSTSDGLLKGGTMAALILMLGAGLAFTTNAAAQDSKPASGDKDPELETVTVTAQFRNQNLQDTPLAITAITAEMLEARSETNI